MVESEVIPLCERIRAGETDRLHDLAYFLEYTALHLPERMIVPALQWLVSNGLTGSRFLEFVDGTCGRSGLELIRHLTMRLEREKSLRRLTVADIQ